MVKKWIGKLQFVLFIAWCGLSISSSAFGEIVLEYITPTPDSSPADLEFDAEGNLWFTELNANRIGKLVPSEAKSLTSQGITEYELPHPNSKPHYLTIAKNGMVWFTELGGNRIGSLNPKTGAIKEYNIPTPHSQPHEIAEAEDGSLWFLEFQTNKIGRLDPETGKITEFQVGSGNPHALALVGDKLWYTQGGQPWVNTFFNKIGCFDMKTGEVVEIEVPPEKSGPHGMTASEKGTVWFTQTLSSKLGKLDYKNNQPYIVEYFVGQRRHPHDVHADEKRGFIWFTASHPDAIGRLDLSKARPDSYRGIKYYKLPNPDSHPTQIALDKEGHIWFTEPGMFFRSKYNNKIGLLIP